MLYLAVPNHEGCNLIGKFVLRVLQGYFIHRARGTISRDLNGLRPDSRTAAAAERFIH